MYVKHNTFGQSELQAVHAVEAEELKTKCSQLETDVASLKDILENESMEVENLQVCMKL